MSAGSVSSQMHLGPVSFRGLVEFFGPGLHRINISITDHSPAALLTLHMEPHGDVFSQLSVRHGGCDEAAVRFLSHVESFQLSLSDFRCYILSADVRVSETLSFKTENNTLTYVMSLH